MAYTTIDDPSAHFHTQLYTGNRSSTQTITNDGNSDLKPDWVWIKHRNDTVAHSHSLIDSSRGVTKGLASNLNEAEYTSSSKVTSFNTDGFSIGNGASVNQPDRDVNYVAWQWKCNGGTTSSNSNGSITSTVQANTTAGFSIVTYTGNGTEGATVGHGLSSAPDVILCKNRSEAENWAVYALDGQSTLFLNLTNTENTTDYTWDSTNTTSSVTQLGSGDLTNKNTNNYIHYCFHSVKGYSKFGSYTGNNNADGTFVYTGFKPAWLLIKRTESAAKWFLWDNKRDTFNISQTVLVPNATQAEETDPAFYYDLVSNGFKVRNNFSDLNTSGEKYIYMAFAEHPFVSSKGVPVTAR